jgi:VanZ family protein
MTRPHASAWLVRFGPAAAAAALIPLLSLLPSRLFRPLEAPLPAVPALDKAVHALLYAALTGACLHALPPHHRRRLAPALGAAALATLYGLLMELGQALTATRSPDPLDALANAVGASACALAVRAEALRRRRRSHPS